MRCAYEIVRSVRTVERQTWREGGNWTTIWYPFCTGTTVCCCSREAAVATRPSPERLARPDHGCELMAGTLETFSSTSGYGWPVTGLTSPSPTEKVTSCATAHGEPPPDTVANPSCRAVALTVPGVREKSIEKQHPPEPARHVEVWAQVALANSSDTNNTADDDGGDI
jgi:hypothetical protein